MPLFSSALGRRAAFFGRSAVLTAPAFLAASVLFTARPAAAADPPNPELVFAFRPAQKGVDIETPPKEDWARCQVKVERQGKSSGWAMFGPQGQLLRRFLDTDGDNVVEQWRYYRNGVEVYRDLDTNKNNKVDQSRWLNTAGTRWGLDENEDGRIDRWKMISAEEASRVAVEALIRGDEPAMQSVLITAADIEALGVSAELSKQLSEATGNPSQKMREVVRDSKIVGPDTSWLRFDSSSPGVIPADAGKAKNDLFVYENAMAIVDVKGQPGLIQVGEMVRVGDVWKLTQIPLPIEGDTVQIAAGGILMQPQLITPDNVAGGITPAMRKLLEELQQLDANSPAPADGTEAFARYNAKRAEVLTGLMQAAESPEEKDQWTRQLADSVSAAVQTGVYPDGLEALARLERQLKSENAAKDLQAYVSYRNLVANYSRRLQQADSEGRLEVQKWWLGQLKSFTETYPESPDSGEAMLQLAVSEEFSGNVDQATDWYQRLAKSFPQSDPGKRAAGAVYRLGLKGQPVEFTSTNLAGRKVSMSDFRGKVTLILFWSTWCKPCADDLPQIRALYEKHHGQGFEILGVNLDQSAEPVEPYLKKHNMSWPQIHESGALESRPALNFGIVSLPTMILVGRDGKVVSRAVSVDDLTSTLPGLLSGEAGK